MDPENTPDPTPDDSPDLDISAAFAPTDPTPAPEPTPEPNTGDDPPAGKLPEGSVWDTGDEKPGSEPAPEPAKDAPEPAPEPAKADGPEIPDGEEVFPNHPVRIKEWNDFRSEHKRVQQENADLRKQLESSPKGNSNNDELEKLRKEYPAVDRIRRSEAYAAEVMAPRSEALAKAKQIGQYAHIDAEDIEDLFRAENAYEAKKMLRSLGDDVAESQLEPLVMAALEAQEKGLSALKSADPLAELKEWEARSMEIQQSNQQMLQQHEAKMDKVALESAFQNRIAKTVIGNIPAAEQIKSRLMQEIETGQPVDRDTIYEGLFHQKMSPVYFSHMTQQAARIRELEQQLQSVSGDYQPGPTGAEPRQRQQAGRLPVGEAWGT